jgi:hypothetical protein
MELHIKWFKSLFDSQIEHLEEYLVITEETLENKLKEFDESVEEKVKELAEENKEEFYEFYSDDYWKYSKVIPNLNRSSIFLLFYTFFEHKLFLLAENLSSHKKCKLNQKDISGQGIERTKIYFEKVLGINFPSNSIEWERLKNYGKIRNSIAHNGSKVKESEFNVLNSFSNTVNNFSINHLKEIELKENFLSNFLKDVQELFNRIYSSI